LIATTAVHGETILNKELFILVARIYNLLTTFVWKKSNFHRLN